MNVLTNFIVVIILIYMCVSNQFDTLNLHSVISQLYFNKAGEINREGQISVH